MADAALAQCDMAEELSRQLEDILSTYCRESVSDDNTVANGQSHSPEFNGLNNDKEEDKQGGNKVNREVDKEQKKSQDKKKVKGLGKWCFPFLHTAQSAFHLAYLFYIFIITGKEITLLMQTLNTLSTPDEKLAGLCKKYAELVSSVVCS